MLCEFSISSLITAESCENAKRLKGVEPSTSVSSDEKDMFDNSNDTEDEIPIKAINEAANSKTHSNHCQQSVKDDDTLGQSSTSIEELEISSQSISKNQNWTINKSDKPTDRTTNSFADSSCIILDDSSSRQNVSEISLGDSESQEDDSEHEVLDVKPIPLSSDTNTDQCKKGDENDAKQRENTPSLFTSATNVPLKKIDSISDSSSSEYSMFKTTKENSNIVITTGMPSKFTSAEKSKNNVLLLEQPENNLPLDSWNKNGVSSKSPPLVKSKSVVLESESNTGSTASGNSGISADDEATHSALHHDDEQRNLSSLSCSSRPGSSMMYANSPGQHSAFGSDVSPITRPTFKATPTQRCVQEEISPASISTKANDFTTDKKGSFKFNTSSKEISSLLNRGLVGRKYSTPGRSNSVVSTDEEYTTGTERKPSKSPVKRKTQRKEQEYLTLQKSISTDMDLSSKTVVNLHSDDQPINSQSDIFKTPQSNLASPTLYCTTQDQECNWLLFKASDLNLIKERWPEAHSYLMSKCQGVKKFDVNSEPSVKKDNRRTSDISSLSSNSRSSSSTGYLADIGASSSSGASSISSLSTKSKRDRLSIDPESSVGRGRLIAPLPKYSSIVKQPHVHSIEEDEKHTSMCSTAAVMGSQSIVQDNHANSITQSIVNEEINIEKPSRFSQPKVEEELIPIKTRTKRKTRKISKDVNTNKLNSKKLDDVKHIESQEIPVQDEINLKLDLETNDESTTKPLMKKGMQVFAKWVQKTEVRFYPGIITEENAMDDDDTTFTVQFYDGYEKDGLKWDDMIPVGMLEMGQSINVEDADLEEGIYYPAVLSAYPEFLREENESNSNSEIEVKYTVDYKKPDSGCSIPQFETERISHKRVFLDKHQAASIKKSLGGNWDLPNSNNFGADMSLDNLVSGKRKPRLSTKNNIHSGIGTPQKAKCRDTDHQHSSPKALRSGSLRRSTKKTPNKQIKKELLLPKKLSIQNRTPQSRQKTKRGGDCVESSVAEDEEPDVENNKRRYTRKVSETVPKYVCALSTTEDEGPGKTPPKFDRRKRKGLKIVAEHESNIASCTKRANSKKPSLFHGLHFVLTQGSKPQVSNKRELDEAEMTSAMETETESELADVIPKDPSPSDSLTFDRKKLKENIIQHGGVVLNEFPGGAHSPFPQPLLTDSGQEIPKLIVVSDRYCQTMSFLLAIGFGIVRISHLWVLQSITEGKQQPMKNYYLPVGWSLIEGREIEQSEHNFVESSNVGIFNELHILISSSDNNFVKDWKPLLARLGANVSYRSKGKLDKSLKAINVAVIDEPNVAKSIIQSSMEKNIPIVNASWIIQSLINGCRVSYEHFQISASTER